ncbi:F0F1 ATP synthase subunit A [Paremcibacter congregatus]|uniref:ATP synthase subunit a n=1 Tax=Paremcibacter congregatus TaxID=2043170 RepID=A0A2G4YVF1_9PROT|nr:F0F1 ATP synthase subunit A [Paremcibacter congregatus]QDE29165.1 F0F1 ATP synthase subunit A [Paremcibacter congregatus]
MVASPLAQFEIKTLIPLQLGEYDISFTNSSLFMGLTVIAIMIFMIGGMRKSAMVPGRWQLSVEMCYEFVANMLQDAAGREARKYFPFIFTLFMFILFANLMGMIPYLGFTVTSHIAVTFAMAGFVFVGVTLIGLAKHGFKFFKLFVPEGAPLALMPLLVVIELVSYLSRPISLSVRLFANMVAGHTMLKVFGGFVVALGVLGVVPFVFIVALTGLELLVACLQAYVFAILTCMYLNDALHLH